MAEALTRFVDGYQISTSGGTTCPHPELCDIGPNESYEEYVERHAEDHGVRVFQTFEDTERSFGLRCFYAFHKYIWKNDFLSPYPFWELHEFISNWVWNEEDLEQRTPHTKRLFTTIPPADERRPGEYRRFKQVEVPRQNLKTTMVSRAYPVFRQLGEHFIEGRDNYRVLIRSATSTNSSESLEIIYRMAAGSKNIRRLYGVWIATCPACGEATQAQSKVPVCLACDAAFPKRTKWRRIALINDKRGSGATGPQQVSLRWLTEAEDADAVAAYSFKAAGLETECTGWRPDLYDWDDPQTDKNSRTQAQREKIRERFDDSVRQLELTGQLLVCDTRKFIDDFAGKIQDEPLISLFHSIHRKARWQTDEPDAAPFVVDGYRYYYPLKGNGGPALDKHALDDLEMQMVERKYSAEFLNEPIDPKRALFKRDHFTILDVTRPEEYARIPEEVIFGLNADVTYDQQKIMERLRVKILAYNACDPSGKQEQSTRGDESAIVGLRVDRYGAIYITYIAGGQWPSSRLWDEIYASARYNRPTSINYEMGVDELHARASYEKWARDKSEELGFSVILPMDFDHMPKSSKWGRIEQMEQWTKGGKFFILSNAASPAIIEKFISQWLNYQATDHDDYPDATSRLLVHLIKNTYRKPAEEAAAQSGILVTDGVASVPMDLLIKAAGARRPTTPLWGQGGSS